MNKQALNMLGLCMRAGRMVSGELSCLNAIRRGTACLVLVDESASDNTKKMFSDSCAYYEVALIAAPQDTLGYAIGKPGRKVAAITDESFAGRIQQLAGREA